MLVENAENQSSRVTYVKVKTARTAAVATLVDNAGFSLPLIVGISAKMNIQVPTVSTKSCQTMN